MEIDNVRVGATVDTDKKLIKKMLKKAPEADSISVCVDGDTMYFILYRNSKVLGKVDAEWCLSAFDSFMEDVRTASSEAH